MAMKKMLFLAIVLKMGMIVSGCSTSIPVTYTDTFNVSPDHFHEIRRGPWETMGNTHYRLIIDHDEEIIHVRGRGSNDEDMKDNFDFRVREPAEEWFSGVEGIKVHLGFLRRYRSVRDLLLTTTYQYPDYAIRASGYSLGGTWTQLFLLDAIIHWPDRDIEAIFYAPANPWRKLPKKYQKELKQRTVFVRSIWDPVTWMRPLLFFRYGYNITIGKWWRIFPAQHYPPQMLRALEEKFPDDHYWDQ